MEASVTSITFAPGFKKCNKIGKRTTRVTWFNLVKMVIYVLNIYWKLSYSYSY